MDTKSVYRQCWRLQHIWKKTQKVLESIQDYSGLEKEGIKCLIPFATLYPCELSLSFMTGQMSCLTWKLYYRVCILSKVKIWENSFWKTSFFKVVYFSSFANKKKLATRSGGRDPHFDNHWDRGWYIQFKRVDKWTMNAQFESSICTYVLHIPIIDEIKKYFFW